MPAVSIERPGYGTRVMARLALQLALAATGIAMLLISLSAGTGDWIGAAAYAAFAALILMVFAIELGDALPRRFELDDGTARLFVRGALRAEMALDATVVADVVVSAGATPFKVDPFAAGCCSPDAAVEPLPFQVLEAVRLTKGDDTIECSVEQGWRPEDLARLWPRLLHEVRARGMARGEGLQRFVSAQEEPVQGLPRAPEGYGRQFWEIPTDELLER